MIGTKNRLSKKSPFMSRGLELGFAFGVILIVFTVEGKEEVKVGPYDKEIGEIVGSSKSCMDAKSVNAGKCSSSLKEGQFLDLSKEISEGNIGLKDNLNQTKIRTGEIIVFVSLSMPVASLKSIYSDLLSVGGRMVVQGLVEGSFKKMQQKMSDLKISVDVDPTLFENYNIKSVPAVMNRLSDTEFDLLRGNTRLEWVLEEFSHKGDYKLQATHLLKKMRDKTSTNGKWGIH